MCLAWEWRGDEEGVRTVEPSGSSLKAGLLPLLLTVPSPRPGKALGAPQLLRT